MKFLHLIFVLLIWCKMMTYSIVCSSYHIVSFFIVVDLQSRKMEKLLAALSLPQVGAIQTIPITEDEEGKGGLFSLALNNRKYTLRAKTDEEATNWVNVLTEIQQKAVSPEGTGGKAAVAKKDGKDGEFVKESRGCCC